MDEKTFISERFASVLEGIPVSLEYGGAATQLAFTAAEEIGHMTGIVSLPAPRRLRTESAG